MDMRNEYFLTRCIGKALKVVAKMEKHSTSLHERE